MRKDILLILLYLQWTSLYDKLRIVSGSSSDLLMHEANKKLKQFQGKLCRKQLCIRKDDFKPLKIGKGLGPQYRIDMNSK